MRTLFVVIVLAASTALAQVTLGDVYKPGQRVESAFPDAGPDFRGGLLFGLDAGTLYYSTGSAWKDVNPPGDVQTTGLLLFNLSPGAALVSASTHGFGFTARYDGGIGVGSCFNRMLPGTNGGTDGGFFIELRRYLSDGGYVNDCSADLLAPFDAGQVFPFICSAPLYAGSIYSMDVDAGRTPDTVATIAWTCNIGWPAP